MTKLQIELIELACIDRPMKKTQVLDLELCHPFHEEKTFCKSYITCFII